MFIDLFSFEESGLREHTLKELEGSREVVLKIPPFDRVLCYHLSQTSSDCNYPHYPKSWSDFPEKSDIILLKKNSNWMVLCPLYHKGVKARIASVNDALKLFITGDYNDGMYLDNTILITACDSDPYHALHCVVERALVCTGTIGRMLKEKSDLPFWFDMLGWESRSAFKTKVSHNKIVDAILNLRDKDIIPQYVIIDEGWQELDNSYQSEIEMPSLYNFEANKKNFPYGLAGIVKSLKDLGVRHVGVWHSIMGHPGGVHPSLAGCYDLPQDNRGRYFLGYDLGRTFQFFNDYYQHLRQCGVSFVKVGDQHSVRLYGSKVLDTSMIYHNLHSAVQAAAALQFGGVQLNTDCICNANTFYWSISQMARISDEVSYSSERKTALWIRNNLTTSLWLRGAMNLDFGSWCSSHGNSDLVSVFQALSGSLNIIGDADPGTNTSILKRLILPSGALLKADKPLTLCEQSICVDPLEEREVYQAYTVKGENFIIGLFNICLGYRGSLKAKVSPSYLPGIDENDPSFAVYSFRKGFLGVLKPEAVMELKIESMRADIITLAPIRNGIAVIGSHLFYLAPGPISEVDIEEESLYISSYISAPMLIYSEHEIFDVRRDGAAIPWEYDGGKKLLSIDTKDSLVEKPTSYAIHF